MKIAIVHEMLIKLGGAERVLQEFMEMYPDADVFTLMYDEKKVGSVFPKDRRHGGAGKITCTGPAQWLFRLTGQPRASLPLMPFSIAMFDFSDYDLVISSSSGFAHGARVRREAGEGKKEKGEESIKKNPSLSTFTIPLSTANHPKHICYCHSPARYLWDWSTEIQSELGISKEESRNRRDEGISSRVAKRRNLFKMYILGPMVKLLFWWLRKVDLKASKRPDLYIANSEEVQKRIKKYYNRDSIVLWPSADTVRFSVGSPAVSQRSHYIITSALTPFKRLDIPIRVLSKLGIHLKIIGGGNQKEELQRLAGPTVEFLGRLSDEQVAEAYKSARGFLMPQKEDAGIAPIEAMAAGLPVFGQAAGGLLEINIDGVTGRFFPEENDESFEAGFVRFHQEISEGKYDDAEKITEHAKKYDTQEFRQKFRKIVENAL